MMVYTTLLSQAGRYAPSAGPIFWRIFLWFLPLIFVIAFYILLAVCIYRAAKFFGSAAREQKLLRIEMSKLAEEVHLLRQEMEGGSPQKSLTESE